MTGTWRTGMDARRNARWSPEYTMEPSACMPICGILASDEVCDEGDAPEGCLDDCS